MNQEHLAELRAALAGVRRRWVATRALRAVARLLVGVCGAVTFLLAAEFWLAPPDLPMLWLAATVLLATTLFAARVLWPLRERPSDRRVARLVEERCPEFEDRVASATELAERGAAAAFYQLVVADAAKKLRGVGPGRVVVPPAQLRAALVRSVLATVALLVLLAVGGEPIGRVARTAWLYAFGSDLTFAVEPGDVRVVAGQPVRVRARLSGSVSAPARTPPTMTLMRGGASRLVRMRAALDGDGYLAEFPAVDESFVYRVSAAAVRSRAYRVDAMVAPRIRRIDVEYLYPAFTGLAPRVEEDGGDIYAPAGTTVRVTAHADTPVVSGRLVLSDGRQPTLEAHGPETLQATFTVETDGEYRLSVTDRDGLSSSGDIDYFIRATLDRAPDVQVLRPGGDREITALEEVVIEARADDDYQVGSLELVYTVAGRTERAVRLGPSDPNTQTASVTSRYTLFAEDLDLAPGDFLTYYARASDLGYTGHSNVARSDIFFLEVRRFDNEFEEAQSQSGIGRDAEQLGDLAGVQKEIIVATWRLDVLTRSEAVAGDIQAVARAQAELRDRVAGAADSIRGRGRDRAAGETGPAPQNTAMSAALAAMASAQLALQGMQTDTALPHEMEALNQLLTAQAEIRRRQVSTERGQGAQTPGTQAQEDLSALFDRELRREQETNYETSSRPRGSAGEDVSDTLRRLRELAERQAELNRQLDRPEEDRPEETRRRALERLTREQQELREQLEQLAQALARGSQGGGQGQGQPDGAPLDEAAEQMRRATSELRREDAEQALANGEQVLDQLRRLEQQLRGATEDARADAVAELEFETRQIAEAQRRVAVEVGQVEADNRSADARVQLADDKERLADRVDALDRDLRGVGDAHPADEAVRAARETLAQEEVARRMRAAADRLRTMDAGGGPASEPGVESDGRGGDETGSNGGDGLAEEEAALADALAGVADQLRRAGTERNDEARQLAEQLDAAQELRRALQRLGGETPGSARSGGSPDVPPGDPADQASSGGSQRRDGTRQAPGAEPSAGAGGATHGAVAGGGEGSLGGQRREYVAGLARNPGLLDELRRDNSELRRDLDAWAEHWASASAPGSEGFKQDFANWDSLRRNLDTALQRVEDARSRALAEADLRDGVTGGREAPVPPRYRQLVDHYYRSLASQPGSP